MPTITIEVPGLPATAGSKRGFVVRGRVVIVDDCKRNKEWVKRVKMVAMESAPRVPLKCPVRVKVEFRLPRPHSHYNKKGLKPTAPNAHLIRPDATKLWRAVEDALTGIVWEDDAQVVEQTITKVYGDQGVTVCVQWGA